MAAPNIVTSATSTYHHMLCLNVTLSAASVAAAGCYEQNVTITGLEASDGLEPADQIMSITKATYQAGLAVVPGRVTAANTLTMMFVNPTAAPIVPTANDVYSIVVFRPNQMITNALGTAI